MDHRPHIVVVEDEAAQRQLLVNYLAKQNFRVSGADGGAALRRLVDRELPQLVLLDIGLPGEDGFALARWLREKSGRIGIIMVTIASDTVDRVVGLETGADDYIPKPFDLEYLEQAVSIQLAGSRMNALSVSSRMYIAARKSTRRGRHFPVCRARPRVSRPTAVEESLAACRESAVEIASTRATATVPSLGRTRNRPSGSRS